MRTLALGLTILLLLATPAFANPASELLGSWRSNRELTLAEMDKSNLLGPEEREILSQIIGQLVLTYTKDEVTNYLQGTHFASRYELVRETPNSVIIVTRDEVTQAPVQQEIFVEGDRMWVALPQLGFKEIFTRIEPSAVPANTEVFAPPGH